VCGVCGAARTGVLSDRSAIDPEKIPFRSYGWSGWIGGGSILDQWAKSVEIAWPHDMLPQTALFS
jgi:hypothetical protein